MKKRKSGLLIVLLIVLIGAAVFGWYRWTHREQEEEITYTVMAEGTLPVLSMELEGEQVNVLHGYVQEMEPFLTRDSITQLTPDRSLTLAIDTAGQEIESLSYSVRSLNGKKLIEENEITRFSRQGENLSAKLTLSALMEQNTEYQLNIRLALPDAEVWYYTRVIYGPAMHTKELYDFAKRFSDATFDRETAKEIVRTFVANDSPDYEKTFAYTDLHSSFTKITWGSLEPVKNNEVEARFTEISPSQVSLSLSYKMNAKDGKETFRDYRVRENFCLRFRDGNIYVLDYARTVDQIFSGDKTVLDNGNIRIGIAGEHAVDVMSDEKGNYTAFTYGNELWCYNVSANEMIRVFTFHGSSTNAIRDDYAEHDISPIKVDSDGNLYFMVYGYMNRGIHEGTSGITFCRYNSEDNAITELHYIPATESYQVLKQDLSRLAYVTEDHICYILYGSNLYRIDLNGSEAEIVSEGVDADTYVRSVDGASIAWQNIGSVHGAITVLNLEEGEPETLNPAAGEYLRTFGFIQNDLIYGVGRNSEIQVEAGREILYPCYRLAIRDRAGKEVEDYRIDKVYVIDTTIESGRILLTRVRKNSDGSMREADQDILLLNASEVNTTGSTIRLTSSDTVRQEQVIELKIRKADSLVFDLASPKFVVKESTETHLSPSDTRRQMLFVYGRGGLLALCSEMADAIDLAFPVMGIVTNAQLEDLWNRNTRALNVKLELPALSGAHGPDSLSTALDLMLAAGGKPGFAYDRGESPYEILSQAFGNAAVEMYGCAVSQVLFYLNLGSPVLAVTEEHGALLLTGYETGAVTIYDPAAGAEMRWTMDEAETFFTERGNRFVSFRPAQN